MGLFSKPKTKTTQTIDQTQTNGPWEAADSSLRDMVNRANAAMANTPTTPVFTGPNKDQLAAVDAFRALAGQAGQGANDLRNLGTATARGDFLHAESNPYLQGAIEAAQRPLQKQLTSNIMAANDAAQVAGAYGGSRGELLKAKAITGFNEVSMDTAAKMLAENYQFERGMQQNAGNLLAQANVIGMQPGQLLGEIGDMQSKWDIAKATAVIDAPWAGLDRYAQILGTTSPYGQTHTEGTNTTTSKQSGGGLGSVLGGALGGASGLGSLFGPWGAGIGAVVGGLGGLFG